ncbi:MAG: hypothetical protein GXP62_17940 [Oligoflexia bacterium]|nr:hypothetical protein [Oligoflexia bacterium]
MLDISDETLLLYAADALDPDVAVVVRSALKRTPALRDRLRQLGMQAAVPPQRPAAFRVPPPGLGLAMWVGRPRVMGPACLRVGDRFQVRLDPRQHPDREGVIILRDLGEGWQVVTPARVLDAVSLSRLPVEADGCHRVDLVARPPAGRQRWAVALVPLNHLPAATPPLAQVEPWSELRRGMADGTVPVGVVEIQLT